MLSVSVTGITDQRVTQHPLRSIRPRGFAFCTSPVPAGAIVVSMTATSERGSLAWHGGTPVRLAPGQEREWEHMWALSPSDPGASRAVVVATRSLEGPLDHRAMQLAFADVTNRHDALRLTFETVGPDPRVRIMDQADPPVSLADLTGLPESAKREWMQELLYTENRRCFDLRHGPLWHAWFVRVGPTTHALTACFLHIIADGWSGNTFMADLLACYGARAGLLPAPAEEALSFEDISVLQARRLKPTADRLRFWREALASLPTRSYPPTHVRPGADLLAGAAIDFALPAHTTAALRLIAWRARTTPFVCLLAGYHLLLSLAKGRERTIVSTTTSGRHTQREKKAILQFACELYVGTDAPGDATLAGVIRATNKAVEGAITHLVPFTSLARSVNPRFDASRPWADLHLRDGDFYSGTREGVDPDLPGVRVQDVHIPGRPPKDLGSSILTAGANARLSRAWEGRCGPSVAVNAGRDGGVMLFNPEVYDPQAMHDLVDGYLWVITALSQQPDMTVDVLRQRYPRRFRSIEAIAAPDREAGDEER
jgi:condensation domain-containing protein